MTGIFYTYVWGSHTGKGAPLTFTSKANRTAAIHSTKEGDLVFGVVSRNPGDPNVRIDEKLKGRVVSVRQLSHSAAETADFGIKANNPWENIEDGSYRWPYALQPIRTWTIQDPPEYRELAGYTSSTHTQRAITTASHLSTYSPPAVSNWR